MNTENNIIYFDNAATTKPSKNAAVAAEYVINHTFGNPSSLHKIGLEAENIIKNSAAQLKKAFSNGKGEWLFTSGGTESNNTAIFSGILSKTRGKRIITVKSEHPSVLSCFLELYKNGYETIYLSQDQNGKIDPDELIESINSETALISLCHINSETGVINPIEDFAAIAKKKNPLTLFHCDAVQSFGKFDISRFSEAVDYISVSAHKIHGFKGCGALYINGNAPVKPIIFGGGQQKNMRSGTENTIGIAALGVCFSDISSKISQNYDNAMAIKNYIIEKCISENVILNGAIDENSSPFILNMSVLGVRSEVMLHALEAEGIYISAGSACSSRQKTSGVLTAYGLPKERTETAIRLSFCGTNTLEEAEIFVQVFKKLLPKLLKYGGLKR